MPCLVVEPPCVSSPRGGLPNRVAHVVSSLIASFASPGLTHVLHSRGWRQSRTSTAHCVFYAPPGAILSTTQVCIRVDSCQKQVKQGKTKRRVLFSLLNCAIPQGKKASCNSACPSGDCDDTASSNSGFPCGLSVPGQKFCQTLLFNAYNIC